MPTPIQRQQGGPEVIRTANDPGWGSYLVAPSNVTDLPTPARALRVTGAGNVAFIGADGVQDTWSCTDFDIIPVAVKKVLLTGTTATGIHAII